MPKILAIVALVIPSVCMAKPYVISDGTTQDVTHCGIVIDTAAKYYVPVQLDKSCKIDVAAVSVGTHSIKFTYAFMDTGIAAVETTFSSPIVFKKACYNIRGKSCKSYTYSIVAAPWQMRIVY